MLQVGASTRETALSFASSKSKSLRVVVDCRADSSVVARVRTCMHVFPRFHKSMFFEAYSEGE